MGTSKNTASKASKILRDPNSTTEEKSVAASDLAHRNTEDVTSKKVASEASEILRDPDSTEDEKSVAASDLAQRRKLHGK